MDVFQTGGIRTAVGFDLTADTFEFGLVAPDDRDMGTEGGQLMGGATPDTTPPPVMTTMWSRNRSRRRIELYDMCSVLGSSVALGACRYPVGVAPFEELLLALDDLRVAHGRIAIQALKPELVVQGTADDLEDCLLR